MLRPSGRELRSKAEGVPTTRGLTFQNIVLTKLVEKGTGVKARSHQRADQTPLSPALEKMDGSAMSGTWSGRA